MPNKTKEICLVCYMNYCDTSLDCDFNVCQDCLKAWIIAEIDKFMVKGEVVVPCPNRECKHEVSIIDMQKSLDKRNFREICDKYLEIYLCNTEDIRKCPNPDCSNAGVIIPQACKDKLMCQKCSYEWRDPAQYTFLESIKKSIFGSQSFNDELLSYFSELIRGEPCPNCGIIIIKISGCPHMVCQKCSYEFCWDCLGYYKDYQHIGDTACPLRVFVLFPVFWYFLVAINFKLCYSYNIIARIEKSVLYFFFMMILSTLILSSLSIEVFIVEKWKRYRRYRPNFRGIGYKISFAGILLYPMIWVCCISLLYNCEETYNLIVFLFYEACVLICLAGIAGVSLLLYKAFRKLNEICCKPTLRLCLHIRYAFRVFYQQGLCQRNRKGANKLE